MLAVWGYYEQSCFYEHLCANLCVDTRFISLGKYQGVECLGHTVGVYLTYEKQPIFQSGYSILYSNEQ